MQAFARIVIAFIVAAHVLILAPLYYLLVTHWYYGVSLVDTIVRSNP